jgi:nucleoside-diphosphate-sugar epimerase
MRILVTGACGFLGAVLVPRLLAAGFEVIALDNMMYKTPSLASSCADRNFDFVKGDIRDARLMMELIRKADVIIPLAALVGAPLCAADPFGAKSINLDAQLMLLGSVSPGQQIIMPITNSGYGVSAPGEECTEESPLNPVSLYGKHKVQVESVLMQRTNSISLRLATVFGMSPRPRLDLLINDFVYRAVYDRAVMLFEPHFKRNFIHCLDVAYTFLWAIDHFDTMRGNIYNVGLSDANLSKLELCETIQKFVPEFVFEEAKHGRDPDQRNYIVSNKKLEATGWTPSHSLEDGIQELIKGFRMLKKDQYANI